MKSHNNIIHLNSWDFVIAFSIIFGFLGGCSHLPKKSIVDAAQASCVLIRHLTNDKNVTEVCATADELAPYVKNILSARAMSSQTPPVHSTSTYVPVVPVKSSASVLIPQTTPCIQVSNPHKKESN